jgi:hypothetical protein
LRSFKEKLSLLLKKKYNAVFDIYDDMLRDASHKRPTCEEILKKKDLWALNEEDLKIDKEIRKIIFDKSRDENQFIYLYLIFKIKNIYETEDELD